MGPFFWILRQGTALLSHDDPQQRPAPLFPELERLALSHPRNMPTEAGKLFQLFPKLCTISLCADSYCLAGAIAKDFLLHPSLWAEVSSQ